MVCCCGATRVSACVIGRSNVCLDCLQLVTERKGTILNAYQKRNHRGAAIAMWLIAGAAIVPATAAPLPLHSIEGYSGIFSTSSAYIAHPTAKKKGETPGPSVGLSYVGLGHDRNLSALTITEAIGPRAEVGYGLDHLTLGDLPDAIKSATGVSIGKSSVNLHNFNARYQILQESAAGKPFRPAVTLGLHYKTNSDIVSINDDLGGALQANGSAHKSGLDVTLYATKLDASSGTPILYNLGLRSSKAAHLGLLGFTDERKTSVEGSIEAFVKPNVIVGAEYRQKPNSYTAIPGLVEKEQDWFTVVAAYIINDTATVSGGYGHFGTVLNHDANASWGLAVKNEF
jgi:hypothetical protein